MENLEQKVKTAEWLSEDQRSKLLRILSTVKRKDAITQGLDLLNLNEDAFFHYRQVALTMIRVLSMKGVRKSLGDETDDIAKYLEAMFTCFDVWYTTPDAATLVKVNNILHHPNSEKSARMIDSLLRTPGN